MQTVLYYLGLASLFTHELDAVTHAEWRMMLVLRSLPDATASPWFVGLHVPLFFAILWLSQHPNVPVRRATQITVASFLVVHAALHFSMSAEPLYDFHGLLSQVLIFGAAVFGFGHLLVRWRDRGAKEAR